MSETKRNAVDKKEQYEIKGVIGNGGTSAVYFAVEKNSGMPYALKVKKAGCFGSSAEEEADIMRSVKSRFVPSVKAVISYGEDEALIMEYKSGKTLEEVIADGGLQEVQMLRLGVEICGILLNMHYGRRKTIYLDMKPANILVRDGRLEALTDFGNSRRFVKGKKLLSAGTGTRKYAPPEQCCIGSVLTFRTDIYSLGYVLRESVGKGKLTGRTKRVLEQCVEKDEKKRPANVWVLGIKLLFCILNPAIYSGEQKKKIRGNMLRAFIAACAVFFGIFAYGLQEYEIGESLFLEGKTLWYEAEERTEKAKACRLCKLACETGKLKEDYLYEAGCFAELYEYYKGGAAAGNSEAAVLLYRLDQYLKENGGSRGQILEVEEELLKAVYDQRTDRQDMVPALEEIQNYLEKELFDEKEKGKAERLLETTEKLLDLEERNNLDDYKKEQHYK